MKLEKCYKCSIYIIFFLLLLNCLPFPHLKLLSEKDIHTIGYNSTKQLNMFITKVRFYRILFLHTVLLTDLFACAKDLFMHSYFLDMKRLILFY